jgi:hypothetical protein
MVKKIRTLREAATELKAMSGGMPAVDRNVDRILASIKILEINFSGVADILEKT